MSDLLTNADKVPPCPHDASSTPLNRDKAILLQIAFIVFLDMIGMGLVIPVMPKLIMEVSQFGLHKAAEIGGYLLFSYALMQFLCASLIGALSDQFGRRPVLLVTLFALGLNYLTMASATLLSVLVIGRLVSGIMGATWAAANACIADIMPKEERGGAFGLVAGAGAAGYVLGPAIGGIAGEYGTRLPFLIAGCLAIGGAVLAMFLLRETLPVQARRPFSFARANPVSSLLRMSRNTLVFPCLLTVFFLQLSAQAHLSIWAFYGAEKFGWTPILAGISVSVYGAMLGTTQATLTKPSIRRLGALQAAKYSLMFAIPSYLLLAFAPSTSIMFVAIVIGYFTGVAFPALQALMTSAVGDDAQGELQGAVVSTIGLTSIIGPIAMTQTFQHFGDSSGLYFPGAPFILSTGLILIALIAVWSIRVPKQAQ